MLCKALGLHALRRVQSESGFWRNILNDPNAPDETSCTVIITAIYAWGVNNGLFSQDFYRPMIRRARNAIKRKFWRGYGSGNCRGTLPAYRNPAYYITRGQHIWVMPLITLALVESAKMPGEDGRVPGFFETTHPIARSKP